MDLYCTYVFIYIYIQVCIYNVWVIRYTYAYIHIEFGRPALGHHVASILDESDLLLHNVMNHVVNMVPSPATSGLPSMRDIARNRICCGVKNNETLGKCWELVEATHVCGQRIAGAALIEDAEECSANENGLCTLAS